MAWTKTKITVTGAMVLAVIASAVGVKWRFFPAVKDEYFKSSYQQFEKVPGNLLVVRPTHYSLPAKGTSFSSGTRSPAGQFVTRHMGRNVPLEQVMATAYQCSPSRIVPPTAKPPGNFDFLVTVPDPSQERLKAAIQKKLGYTAHWETRDTDVLLIETLTPDPTGLKVSPAGNGNVAYKRGKYEFTHMRISSVTGFLEYALKRPVLDRTGLTNFYDFSVAMNWRGPDGPDQKTTGKILDDLGLKLEPGTESMQMLVVEKIH